MRTTSIITCRHAAKARAGLGRARTCSTDPPSIPKSLAVFSSFLCEEGDVHLLATKDEALLRGRNALLLLHALLDARDLCEEQSVPCRWHRYRAQFLREKRDVPLPVSVLTLMSIVVGDRAAAKSTWHSQGPPSSTMHLLPKERDKLILREVRCLAHSRLACWPSSACRAEFG